MVAKLNRARPTPEHVMLAEAAMALELVTKIVPKIPPIEQQFERMVPVLNPNGKVDMLAVGSPLPKSIGLCADLYNDVRELRLLMEKEVDVIKAREAEVKTHIIDNLSKSDDTGAAGKRYRAQIVMKTVPQIADWKVLMDFVSDTGRYDLVQKRVGEKAVKDMWDANEAVPGVAQFNTPTVSITKI